MTKSYSHSPMEELLYKIDQNKYQVIAQFLAEQFNYDFLNLVKDNLFSYKVKAWLDSWANQLVYWHLIVHPNDICQILQFVPDLYKYCYDPYNNSSSNQFDLPKPVIENHNLIQHKVPTIPPNYITSNDLKFDYQPYKDSYYQADLDIENKAIEESHNRLLENKSQESQDTTKKFPGFLDLNELNKDK
jgi:hypothetical protein